LSEHACYKEAEPLYQRALAIREQSLGPEHPEVATSPAIPAARIKVLCDPIISSVRQPVGCLYPAFETLF